MLANAHVTRLLFNSTSSGGNLTAYGVEYVLNGGGQKLSVGVNKEVILAGGSVGSPAVLLYSGVGPSDVLNAAGVPVISELPGVGQHLQDHIVRILCMHRHTYTNYNRASRLCGVPISKLGVASTLTGEVRV